MITQLFILGSSSSYGVGASNAGWGDLVKQYMQAKMYGEGGVGEKYEVYNFGKSGAKVNFVQETFPRQLEEYGRGGRTIAFVAIGGNNTKAEGEPDNFVSTPEEYVAEMREVLGMLKGCVDELVVVGSNGYVDEAKTNPKLNPLTGDRSYFTNARRQQFKALLKQLCDELGIPVIDVEVEEKVWRETYLYRDGLHPNQAGHQLIFDSIRPLLDTYTSV